MPKFARRFFLSALRVLLMFSILIVLIGLSIARPTWTERGSKSIGPRIELQALRDHVSFLSEHLPTRSSDEPIRLEQAANYIFAAFSDLGAEVRRQRYRSVGREYQNVIAQFGPDTEPIIVVGAHYDAYNDYPGADDNASGVAALLELGRLLNGAGLAQRIVLVAYTLEEPPHYASESMGSYVHAQSIADREVELMISIEMIGYYSDEIGSQRYPTPLMRLFYPSRGNYIAVVEHYFANNAANLKASFNRYTDLPAHSINAPAALPGVDFSDHRNYWAAGFPAVMITDTAFYRNRAYHTPFDTADRLDYARMAEVVRGVYHYLTSPR